MFSIAGVYCHYFYMLCTFNSKQLGADNEGLFGFYGEEVKNQIENIPEEKVQVLCKTKSNCQVRGFGFVMIGSYSCFSFRCNKTYCPVYMYFLCG